MEAKQTPLIELLERVPQDARVVVEHDQFSSSSHPVGRLCHEAAAALRAVLAEPEQQPGAWGWVPVTEALPKSGVKVLACYRNRLGNLRRIRAQWIAAKTQEADGEDSEACSEYDEVTDTYFTTEGWYECIDNWGDYSSVAVTEGDVTHWMPLPPDPDTAPTSRKPVVELTDEEIINIGKEARAIEGPHILPVSFARAVIAAYEKKQGEQT